MPSIVSNMIIRYILTFKTPHITSKYFFSHMKVNGNWHFEQLRERTILQLKGVNCADFLQGLVTNDVKLLNNQKAIYAMFLNTKGRILYDSIIYNTDIENTLFLECDSNSVAGLEKHLNLYKVRRKIEISLGEYYVWAIFQPTGEEGNDFKLELSEKSILCVDPRLSSLGYRAVLPKDANLVPAVENSNISYKIHRYKLGIAEGSEELLTGKGFPLEMNCDYLNGVSFNKGCYIGQELTARTHHTGVIRKRVMPLLFPTSENVAIDDPVLECNSIKPKTFGKVIGILGNAGLGLMRVKETLAATTPLKARNASLKCYKPFWWPKSEEHALKKNL